MLLKFKEEIMHILHKLIQKTEEEGTLSNSFCEAITTPMPKSDTTRKDYRKISLMNTDIRLQNKLIVYQIQQKY